MKKLKYLYVTIFGCSALILSYVVVQQIMSNRYDRNLTEMRLVKASWSQQPYQNYFTQYGEYPLNFKEVFLSWKENGMEDDFETATAICSMPDLLSTKNDYVRYIPLHNRHTGRRESFIFLSTGLDGEMDNILLDSDTLYIDSWWTKLKVYNYDEAVLLKDYLDKCNESYKVFNSVDNYPPHPSVKLTWSLIDYLFGEKDLIIQTGPIHF